MYRRKDVLDLYSQTENLVCSKVWRFLRQHAKTCKTFCVSKIPIQQCEVLKRGQNGLSTSTSVLEKMLIRILALWQHYVDTATRTYPEPNHTQMFYIIFFFFYDAGFEYTSVYKVKALDDYFFMFNFGKSLTSIEMNYSAGANEDTSIYWQCMFKSTKKLKVIDLQSTPLTPNLMRAIGKNCDQLRQLRHFRLNDDPEKLVLHLLYADTTNLQSKFSCAYTLELVDVIHNDETKSPSQMSQSLFNTYNLLIENLPKLKSLGFGFCIERFVRKPQALTQLRRTELDTVKSYGLEHNDIQRLVRVCPSLKEISEMYNPDPASFKGLSSLSKITSITLKELKNTVDFYKHFLAQTWNQLRFLDVYDLNNVDLTPIAHKCPGLVTLKLTACSHVGFSYDLFHSFKHLENFTATFKGREMPINCRWFGVFATCIKSISMSTTETRNILTRDGEVLAGIYSANFPRLEKLYLSVNHFRKEDILAVATQCHNFKSFGRIDSPALLDTMKKEVVALNLDITLLNA